MCDGDEAVENAILGTGILPRANFTAACESGCVRVTKLVQLSGADGSEEGMPPGQSGGSGWDGGDSDQRVGGVAARQQGRLSESRNDCFPKRSTHGLGSLSHRTPVDVRPTRRIPTGSKGRKARRRTDEMCFNCYAWG